MRKNKSINKVLAAFFALVSFSAIFTSCKKENVETDPVDDEESVLTVSVAEGDGTVALTDGAMVDLFAIEDNGSIVAQSTITAAQNGQLVGAEAITAVMKDGILLTGYTPIGLWSVETYGQPEEYSVPTDQSKAEDYEAGDLMMAPLTAVADGKVALVMKHVMTKVSVHLTDITGNYDLSAVDIVMPELYTSVTVDLAQYTVTTEESKKGDIIPYSPGNTPYRATATAVVAPGQVSAGKVLVRVSVDGETFTYKLPEDADWQAGKENVYSMRLTHEGLVPYGSYVTEWGEDENNLSGNLEEVFVYEVGDYLLSDGSFIKFGRLTEKQADDVVAVVFSKEVSETDAEAGYNAYAMGVKRITGKKYGISQLVGKHLSEYTSALADLDGRKKTSQLMASEEYQALTDKDKTVFGSLEDYALSYALPSGVASGWFVPSFGQMIQILNNFGGAGLTAETQITDSNNSQMYKSADLEVLNKINSNLEAVNAEGAFPTSSEAIFATSTETNNTFWCVQIFSNNNVWNWGFGKNPQRGSTSANRSLLPCTAVKLPE